MSCLFGFVGRMLLPFLCILLGLFCKGLGAIVEQDSLYSASLLEASGSLKESASLLYEASNLLHRLGLIGTLFLRGRCWDGEALV